MSVFTLGVAILNAWVAKVCFESNDPRQQKWGWMNLVFSAMNFAFVLLKLAS
jgi:multidrug transporter EmrE-like cation transporter